MTVLLLAPAFSLAMEVTPVQKVLQMMENMKAKGLKEKADETVAFTTFMQFCKDTTANKDNAISDGAEEMVKLKADAEMARSEAKTLGKEIEELDKLTDQAKGDKASSTEQFETEEADYQKVHAEYDANIQDIGVGVSQLKSMMGATNAAASAASLIQKMVSSARFPDHAKRVLMAFLATSSTTEVKRSGLDASAPEGATFDSQSGGIVNMMEELEGKMSDEKTTLEQEFTKSQGSYQMLQQTFTDQIDQHTTMRNMKAITKKEKEGAASNADGDHADTSALKAEDETYLHDIHAECATKSSEYESRQKLRAGEVEALNKAIEIISGGAVSGAAGKHLPSLAQSTALATALAQLRSQTTRPSQSAAASFLQAQGRTLNSRVLATLSLRVAEDPFGKVKKMIQDMVYKLMEEANEEAEHKGFCDTELGTNKMTRDQKSTAVAELTATIDEAQTTISQLSEDITSLSLRISETDAAVKEATEIRQAEKEKNAQTVSDAVGASTAVASALKVLQDYYDNAAGAAAFIAEDKPYQGQQSASTGIVGMLEVILSDFERLESDTKEAEKVNQDEYDKFMTESNQDKAVCEQHVKNKVESRTEADVNLAGANKDLKNTQEELDAANDYFEKLKPSCIEQDVSYDDRVERRKAEIESLKEALKILDDQPIA